MEETGYIDYVLFIDSDIGVVNPKRLIEDFIDPQADIIFYYRFFNWEVMAGSYLVRNIDWTRKFLTGEIWETLGIFVFSFASLFHSFSVH
ncbi:hypothetical protein COOONC_25177 [Cooperia oncophora]